MNIVTENAPSGFRVPSDKNVIFYSSLTHANLENVFKGFAVKYIFRGTSCYRIESGDYHLTEHSLLLAPQQPGKVYFEEKKNVVALCTYIDDNLIREAYNLARGATDLDNLLDNYFTFPVFFEKKYIRDEVGYLSVLREIASAVFCGQTPYIDNEWFFRMAGMIVSGEVKTARSFSSLTSAKVGTRKELLKRLTTAKRFMDEHYLEAPDISRIAREAALSQFHFFRTFREAFQETPFQYMQSKRLDYARNLLALGSERVATVAELCHFPDSPTFSKAFKRKFNVSPAYFIPGK